MVLSEHMHVHCHRVIDAKQEKYHRLWVDGGCGNCPVAFRLAFALARDTYLANSCMIPKTNFGAGIVRRVQQPAPTGGVPSNFCHQAVSKVFCARLIITDVKLL